MAVETVEVLNPAFERWGITVNDYAYNSKQVDFQDLLVRISEKRASTVEAEITPVSNRVKTRNKELESLGKALSKLSEYSGAFDTSATNPKATCTWSADEIAGMALIGVTISAGSHEYSKSTIDEWTQLVKTQIDKRNNESSNDMTRLQSLVDKRDESYSTATSLMQAIGDTRANAIKNM